MSASAKASAPDATPQDLKRLGQFVVLLNTGMAASEAIDRVGFDLDVPEVYPEDECLSFDESELLDFTPLAIGCSAIVVRYSQLARCWVTEYRYQR